MFYLDSVLCHYKLLQKVKQYRLIEVWSTQCVQESVHGVAALHRQDRGVPMKWYHLSEKFCTL